LDIQSEKATVRDWKVPGTAEPGDEAFFFFRDHFFARGVVASAPVRTTLGDVPAFRADVEDVEHLLPKIEIEALRRLFPAWGWLSYPRTRTSVPMEIAGTVSKFLCQSVASVAKPVPKKAPSKQQRVTGSK
jgi:hypothetical protein